MFVFKPQIDTSSLAQDEAPPSTFLDTLEANTELLGSSFRNAGREEEAYDARNDAIFDRLGVKLDNPARMAQDPQLGQVDWRGRYNEQLQDLQRQYPDAADIIRADVSPQTEAAQQTAVVQQRAADTASRYPYRLPDSVPLIGGQSVPSALGGAATAFTDPFVVVTTPLMAERVAVGAAGVLWGGIRSAIANGAATAAEQPFVAAWKKQAGLDHTWSDALKEVAANTAFGFLADVGVRGLYRGGQALAGRRPVLDKEGNVIGYRGAADPKADPIAALNDAAVAAPPGTVLRRAAELEPDALRELARHAGLEADPAVRGALDALDQDRVDLVPPAGVLEEEHIAKANDALWAMPSWAAMARKRLPKGWPPSCSRIRSRSLPIFATIPPSCRKDCPGPIQGSRPPRTSRSCPTRRSIWSPAAKSIPVSERSWPSTWPMRISMPPFCGSCPKRRRRRLKPPAPSLPNFLLALVMSRRTRASPASPTSSSIGR